MTSDIDFSVVMPVRNNVNGLRVTLGAFNLFTVHRDRLEVILVVDDDDNDALFYHGLKGRYGFDIRVLLVKPTDNFSDGYYNAAARLTRGSHIWAFNDDCYIQTNKWDDIVRDKIAKCPQFKGHYLVDILDSTRVCGSNGVAFPRFPMISRKAVDVVGFFFFPQVRNWPADKCIWDLYNTVGCVVPCNEVKIQHDHNFDHVGDPSKSRFLRILNEDKANGVFPVNGNAEANRLIEAMK